MMIMVIMIHRCFFMLLVLVLLLLLLVLLLVWLVGVIRHAPPVVSIIRTRTDAIRARPSTKTRARPGAKTMTSRTRSICR